MQTRREEISHLDNKASEPMEEYEQLHDTHRHYNHQIPEQELKVLKEFFDRFKDHQTHKVSGNKLAEFHGEYSKMYIFPVPLHPKNLSQLVHPFHGYLAATPDISLTFNELHDIYLNQIAASYEKTFGRDFLGEELSCFTFWTLCDVQEKGWMNLQEAERIFKALKFDQLFEDERGLQTEPLTIQKLKNEFKFNLQNKQGELIDDFGDTVIRFDFMRELFLERGL